MNITEKFLFQKTLLVWQLVKIVMSFFDHSPCHLNCVFYCRTKYINEVSNLVFCNVTKCRISSECTTMSEKRYTKNNAYFHKLKCVNSNTRCTCPKHDPSNDVLWS